MAGGSGTMVRLHGTFAWLTEACGPASWDGMPDPPHPKDMKMKKSMLDAAAYFTGLAEAADANANRDTSYATFIPSHLAAR